MFGLSFLRSVRGTTTHRKSPYLIPFKVEYLVIAGGGGATFNSAGGGGAGGLRSTVTASGGTPGTVEAALILPMGNNYTVTVGAGGAGGPYSMGVGGNGGASVFSSITTVGGGGAGGDGWYRGGDRPAAAGAKQFSGSVCFSWCASASNAS